MQRSLVPILRPMKSASWQDTIVAISTPAGTGALGVLRMSGTKALEILAQLMPRKKFESNASPAIRVGWLWHRGTRIDEAVVSLFKNPRSFTGEDLVEFSCHGSPFILNQLLNACVELGARLAAPGEFTQRAFLNGKMDLTQAEAVADLIHAESEAALKTALHQMRGGFSQDLQQLRTELIHFAALIELELDFSEEDVEFADRTQLQALIATLQQKTQRLIDSFAQGNVIKHGVRVAIIGRPNVGKSTLLNALLNDDRAIVSEIAGTTRDSIEETLYINDIVFRLVDTAGIRNHSTDLIENIGIERSKKNAEKALVIIHLADATQPGRYEEMDWLLPFQQKVLTVYNKYDAATKPPPPSSEMELYISAKQGIGIEALKQRLYQMAVQGNLQTESTIVTNARHYSALQKIAESLLAIRQGLSSGLSSDLLAIDIRRSLHYLGEITGQVELDRDILGTIFGKFCIGK